MSSHTVWLATPQHEKNKNHKNIVEEKIKKHHTLYWIRNTVRQEGNSDRGKAHLKR